MGKIHNPRPLSFSNIVKGAMATRHLGSAQQPRHLRQSYPAGKVVGSEISDHLVAWIRGAQSTEPEDLDLSGNGEDSRA